MRWKPSEKHLLNQYLQLLFNIPLCEIYCIWYMAYHNCEKEIFLILKTSWNSTQNFATIVSSQSVTNKNWSIPAAQFIYFGWKRIPRNDSFLHNFTLLNREISQFAIKSISNSLSRAVLLWTRRCKCAKLWHGLVSCDGQPSTQLHLLPKNKSTCLSSEQQRVLQYTLQSAIEKGSKVNWLTVIKTLISIKLQVDSTVDTFNTKSQFWK